MVPPNMCEVCPTSDILGCILCLHYSNACFLYLLLLSKHYFLLNSSHPRFYYCKLSLSFILISYK